MNHSLKKKYAALRFKIMRLRANNRDSIFFHALDNTEWGFYLINVAFNIVSFDLKEKND